LLSELFARWPSSSGSSTGSLRRYAAPDVSDMEVKLSTVDFHQRGGLVSTPARRRFEPTEAINSEIVKGRL
jgi:hypothetical protein